MGGTYVPWENNQAPELGSDGCNQTEGKITHHSDMQNTMKRTHILNTDYSTGY